MGLSSRRTALHPKYAVRQKFMSKNPRHQKRAAGGRDRANGVRAPRGVISSAASNPAQSARFRLGGPARISSKITRPTEKSRVFGEGGPGKQPESAVGPSRPADLLSGIEALIEPDYGKLNAHTGRNDRLLHAVLCAYAKHALDVADIGWEQLEEILRCAICEEIGDYGYVAWVNTVDPIG
jgi:hypothetical protein